MTLLLMYCTGESKEKLEDEGRQIWNVACTLGDMKEVPVCWLSKTQRKPDTNEDVQ